MLIFIEEGSDKNSISSNKDGNVKNSDGRVIYLHSRSNNTRINYVLVLFLSFDLSNN